MSTLGTSWEPPDKIGGPVWRYPKALRNAPKYAYDDAKHGELRASITAKLQRIVAEAYAEARAADVCPTKPDLDQ